MLSWSYGEDVKPFKPPLSDAEFHTYLNHEGQLSRPEELRLRIYHGGVEPSLRKVSLLHHSLGPARQHTRIAQEMPALGHTLRGWYGSVPVHAAVGRQAFPKESRGPGWLGGDRYTQGHGSSSVDPLPHPFHPFHPWPGGVAIPAECIPRRADRPRTDGLHETQEPGV